MSPITMSTSQRDITELERQVEAASKPFRTLVDQMQRVIVGQDDLIESLLSGLLMNGHVLIEGVPGLAKTTAVSCLAAGIRTDFRRIQFTPDLLPADLVGTMIYRPNTGEFTVKKGPIFANIILADEINRSPAKVQSALLEAMQERQVTIGETTFKLDEPFLVLATQNPVEQEGTYPLPEAQVDRFMLKIKIGYPNEKEEMEIMRRMARTGKKQELSAVTKASAILEARKVINDIYIDEKVEKYIVDLIFATRYPDRFQLQELTPLIQFGASPRASINLNLAARASAFMDHRAFVTPEDVRKLALDVLRHRVIPTYEAEAEDISSEQLIEKILSTVQVP